MLLDLYTSVLLLLYFLRCYFNSHYDCRSGSLIINNFLSIIIIIIIITLLLLLFYIYIIVSFIQGSHTHIPETNHVPRGYIVTAILSLLFMVPLCLVPALVLLFFYVSTFRSMCALLLLLLLLLSLYAGTLQLHD